MRSNGASPPPCTQDTRFANGSQLICCRSCVPATCPATMVSSASLLHPSKLHQGPTHRAFPLSSSWSGLFPGNGRIPSSGRRRGWVATCQKIGHQYQNTNAEELINVESERVECDMNISTDGNVGDEARKGEPKESQKMSNMLTRFVFGSAIGIAVGAVVVAGGWWFTAGLAAVVYIGTREYFELVRSKGLAEEMTPPPPPVSRACSLICAAMPLMTLYFGGRVSVAVTTTAFILGIVLLLQREKPRFAQFSSAIFGLFYCGYLPSFWVKLRCGTAIPALTSVTASFYGRQVSVGLVATLISFASIIAADTGAYLGGRALGRTPLSNVSPKKTLEGAIVGLSSAFFVTAILCRVFGWPPSLLSAAAFALVNFLGSIFGDLIESMIKRDAGVKDSGRLIPGHGGILDRVDSYVFTGALVYSFVKILL